MSSTAHRSSDLGAALTGLIVGAVALFIIVFTIVKLTNASFAEEHAAAPAATTGAPATTSGTPAPAPAAAH
ncbi:MAG TPA: hypothetical protein VMY38_01050 [Gemmatimonadaceae bacterium]|nr:hypothetical protein [Gemmatimonadaceae bacterium]